MLLLQIKIKRFVRFRFKIFMICSLILWVCVPVYSQTGTVDRATWDVIVRRYLGIDRTVLGGGSFFDFVSASGSVSPQDLQDILAADPGRFPGVPLTYGQRD